MVNGSRGSRGRSRATTRPVSRRLQSRVNAPNTSDEDYIPASTQTRRGRHIIPPRRADEPLSHSSAGSVTNQEALSSSVVESIESSSDTSGSGEAESQTQSDSISVQGSPTEAPVNQREDEDGKFNCFRKELSNLDVY